MKITALSILRTVLSFAPFGGRERGDHGPRRGGATFLRRLLVAFALLGVVGTAAAFKGGALPGPAGVLTPLTQTEGGLAYIGLTWGAAAPSANTPVITFRTGAASTLTRLTYTKPYGNSNGTGTATIDVTDTSGTALMSINYDCATITTFSLPTDVTGSVALTANTQYQVRVKTNCASGGQGAANVSITRTVP